MLQLPNGCFASDITVTPSHWQNKKEFKAGKAWTISYRFYDAKGNKKQVQVRGMNDIPSWKERRDFTEALVEGIEEELKGGYNPILKATVDKNGLVEITDNSTLIDALQFGLDKSKKRITVKTWKDIRAIVSFIKDYVDTSTMKIGGIRRKDVLCLLDKIEAAKIEKEGEFTNNNYNHFRKYLGILFGELIQLQIIETNPVDKYLLKRNVITEERETLTTEERKAIRESLALRHPEFFRFVQMFFHSGARITEMLKVQAKDVNLEEQWFKVLILKGRQWIRVKKTIKNVVFPYWQELMSTCGAEDYLFSKFLKPGAVAIDPHQVTKRWRVHVKENLGITKDLYSLKHLHTDQVAEQLDAKKAQQHNHHKTLKIVQDVYAPGIKKRKAESVKELENEF